MRRTVPGNAGHENPVARAGATNAVDRFLHGLLPRADLLDFRFVHQPEDHMIVLAKMAREPRPKIGESGIGHWALPDHNTAVLRIIMDIDDRIATMPIDLVDEAGKPAELPRIQLPFKAG